MKKKLGGGAKNGSGKNIRLKDDVRGVAGCPYNICLTGGAAWPPVGFEAVLCDYLMYLMYFFSFLFINIKLPHDNKTGSS